MNKPSVVVDMDQVVAARDRFLERSKEESWAEIARAIGVPKSTLYHFVKRNYLPKNQATLVRLIGKDAYRTGTIVVQVHRDGSGKFVKARRGPDQ